MKPDTTKHVCIHGHFYQPPRENPWLEEIEREESAAPFHDWNERIAEECYKPNAAARILDDNGLIGALKNNYDHLSFNYGPTLLRWMERHSPAAYRAILDADARSVRANGGHGNAMAQVYNHVILPLANERDKRTQIRWGARDFEHRFKRKPEGMWLAETAVDQATLAALADEGIAFTVLSPYQARSFRMLDGSPTWTSCEHGEIPTGRAYVYQKNAGRPVHLFFYDGGIARGIAFERMLGDAGHLVGALDHAHATRKGALAGEAWLVNTATDGESYGHHFAHGDMALAAAFARLENDAKVRITNYAAFLAQNPVRAEADIKDVSAWSCAHGVGRWSRDCGCRIGGDAGWTQKWREPLREALNRLRDELATHYERSLATMVRDPWAVRDAYIEVMLDASRAASFAAEHGTKGALDRDADARVKFFSLLEMQRAALLMFTSCGWFFDDVSGGESIILMKYAARAIELARRTGAPAAIEEAFVKELARAESNVPRKLALPGSTGEGVVNGREIYEQRARSVGVTVDKVVTTYALRALSGGARRSSNLYAYRVTHHEEVPLRKGSVPCLVGHVTVEDERTFEKSDVTYALAHFGGLDFRCATRPWVSAADTAALVERVRAAALEGTTPAMMRALDEAFGEESAHTLRDAFLDVRQEAARGIGREKVRVLSVVGAELLENHRALLSSLRDLGVPLPPHVETLASHVLSQDADALLVELVDAVQVGARDTSASKDDSADIEFAFRAATSKLRAIAEEASALGLKLSVVAGAHEVGDALLEHLVAFGKTRDPDRARAALRLVEACAQLAIAPRLWDLQTQLFLLVEAARADGALRDALRHERALVDALDRLGRSAFARRLA
jgi:alpha-amylase/alpha-mannosidase (GH57 family)